MGERLQPSIVLIGGGGHARVVAELIRTRGEFEVAGYIAPCREGFHEPATYLGTDDDLVSLYEQGIRLAAIGIGTVGECDKRRRIIERVAAIGFEFPTLRHPSALIAESSQLDPGVQIIAGSVVQVSARIGEHTLVNTGAIVEHDCVVGNYCHIASGSRLLGSVSVSDSVHVGAGAVVLQGVHIGEGAVIGAGAVVLKDVEPRATVVGVPARQLARFRKV